MQRTDLLDTSDWAYAGMVKRTRAMTPDQRLQLAVELTDLGWQIHCCAHEQLRKERGELGKSGS